MSYKLNGFALIVIAIVLAIHVASYTDEIIQLQLQLHKTCDLPASICPARQVPPQSMIGYFIAGVIFVLGVYNLLYDRRSKKVKVKESKDAEKIVSSLSEEEKLVYSKIKESDGAAFQTELVEKSGLDKVKVTRILDKLEGKGLVERKRRGMSNVVVLKH